MGAHVVTDKQAYELMHAHHWREAFTYWQILYRSGAVLQSAQLNAFAKCCEMLDEWELHEAVIEEGLRRYAENADLQARNRYRHALKLYQAERWASAYEHLEQLRSCNPAEWPFALSYYRWQALLMMQVSALPSEQLQRCAIAEASLFKNACIFSRQLAGFEWVIRLSGWDASIKCDFLLVHQQLVEVFKNHDRQLAALLTEPVAAAVGKLAVFLRAHPLLTDEIPAGYLYFYSRLLLMHGFTDLYGYYRQAFITRMAAVADARAPSVVELLFRIACDNERDATQAEVFVRDLLEQVDTSADGALGKALAVSELYRQPTTDSAYLRLSENHAFASLIAGKSVAIVGPADVGLDNGQDIDSFDLVIRFNHRTELQLNPVQFGSRTDISYYGSTTLNLHQRYLESDNGLQCMVVEEFDLARFEWLRNVRLPIREHLRAWSFDSPFLFGAPSAIQRTLMDILRFQPRQVKVFNMNFYLNIGYAGGYGRQDFNIFPALSIHDPLSNFVFVQKCAAAWGVDTDAVLSEILQLTPAQYLTRLWASHSRFVN